MFVRGAVLAVFVGLWASVGVAWEAEILSDESFGDARRTVVVRLSEPVGDDVLDDIAFRLWGRQSHIAKTYVEYYLPGMSPGAGAWAIALYDRSADPRMKITRLGFTAGKSAAMMATD